MIQRKKRPKSKIKENFICFIRYWLYLSSCKLISKKQMQTTSLSNIIESACFGASRQMSKVHRQKKVEIRREGDNNERWKMKWKKHWLILTLNDTWREIVQWASAMNGWHLFQLYAMCWRKAKNKIMGESKTAWICEGKWNVWKLWTASRTEKKSSEGSGWVNRKKTKPTHKKQPAPLRDDRLWEHICVFLLLHGDWPKT